MTEWLPARTRVEMYANRASENYTWARRYRNSGNKLLNQLHAEQAAVDASKARAMLFDLIDKKAPPDYTGELKLD